jgi:GH24 family phage-related lysozyme (muramidase)
MPDSNDLKSLDSQLKKTLISAESFKKGSSVDVSKSILNIQKTFGSLIGSVRQLVASVVSLEKIVNNNSRKITSLKNISKTQSTRISGENIGAKLPGSSASNVEDSITKIAASVASIAAILAGRQKALDNTAAFDRRKAEQEKRGVAEGNLEKKFEGLKSSAEKVIAPVKSILDRIIDFFVTVFLGRVVYKLLEWFGDKKNADKVKAIGRFLGEMWPKLLALYLVFGSALGGFARGLIGLVVKGAVRLAAAAAGMAAKAGIKGAAGAAGFLGGKYGKLLGAGLEVAATVGTTMAVSKGIENFGGGEQKAQGLAGGGYVRPRFPAFSGGGLNFKGILGGMGDMFGMLFAGGGGVSSGFVSGEKGVDKIPAMLSDGEFVMSAGAVQKYGVDTLEGMNAAGGGTNKPKMISGTTYAAGGGAIGTASHHLKQDESLSSLTKGINDFTNPKSPNWSKVTAKTPVHSYIDSVGQPTIGWGSTYYDSILNGKQPVRRGDTITKDKADNILSTNISGLQKEYSTKIPYWNKMNDNQKAGLLILGYNAPYGPIGAYKKLTAALQQGDMKTAATNVQRGGPNAQRIALERRLLMSGPLNLKNLVGPRIVGDGSKPQSQKPQNAFQQFGSSVASNVMNFFGQPAQAKPVSTSRGSGGDVNTTKPLPVPYENGGYAPKSARPTSSIGSSKPVSRPTIKPLTPPKPRVMYVPAPAPQGGEGYGGGASTSVPKFSASGPGGNAKQKTLGVTR